MLTTLGLAMASTVLTAFGLFGVWALLASRRTEAPQAANMPPVADVQAGTAYLDVLSGKIAALEITVAGLPGLYSSAVAQAEEERERAKNHSNRALQAERRVREILEEDEGDLDEEEQVERVQQLDAIRGDTEEVPAVHSPLGLVDDDYERIARAQAQATQYGI